MVPPRVRLCFEALLPKTLSAHASLYNHHQCLTGYHIKKQAMSDKKTRSVALCHSLRLPAKWKVSSKTPL
jgi:hypothetical protein